MKRNKEKQFLSSIFFSEIVFNQSIKLSIKTAHDNL